MVSVFRSKELHNLGFTEAGIQGALSCCLRRIRRGHFVLYSPCTTTEHKPLHLLHDATATDYPRQYGDIRDNSEWLKVLIRSYADELQSGAVFSHVSAALIHGLAPPFPATESAEVIRPGMHRAKKTLRTRDRALNSEELAEIGDLPVTTIARTLLDLASDYPLEVSVPYISEALRRGLTSCESLRDSIRTGTRGCRQAVQAINLASPAHESSAEALCAVKFFRFNITGMVPQINAYDLSGKWIARNDFQHDKHPLIVEVHGVGKYYLNAAGPDQASSANHERHMKLLNAGYRVFNLVWADLFRTSEFARIRAALAEFD
ncbi:hypothetical protein BSP239C_01412 [Brevibacterium sp. 239c]|uniref:hypothetical protein n=1 Tax=Brevibacterium sp. 239c TaxID=1965356 RepID=UPI000C494FB9|nr:hypothetical protein [Brevibacterium sp. 239c]SMX81104.1 hypothetical protein BSP239C_01412 [Brevibacterium sp. 239c]